MVRSIWNLYQANDIAAQPLDDLLDQTAIAGELANAVTAAGGNGTRAVTNWRRAIDPIDWAAHVPVGLCHGDLAPGNILLRDGDMVILDWERAHRGIVTADFLKLCSLDARIFDHLGVVYDAWSAKAAKRSVPLANLLVVNAAGLLVDYWRNQGQNSSPRSKTLKRRAAIFETLNRRLQG